jgi:hypothetical protein
MAEMTAQEIWDFLMKGTRTAHVATVRADGRRPAEPRRVTGPRDLAG